ncbi:uncharacterized protein [Macrobrachium rosenbergii]|uniref:uncharacterized protein isoform X2 n=1 Tax=Macrobrachium rosenbergii TaxID=79674 RepID=UPI0034D3CCED
MTSFSSAKEIRDTGYMPTFKVQSQVYHTFGSLLPMPEADPTFGSLLPMPEADPKFIQIYFMGDATAEAKMRQSKIPGLKEGIVLDLEEFLRRHHAYAAIFKTALALVPTENHKISTVSGWTRSRRVSMKDVAMSPSFNEVAVVMVVSITYKPLNIVLHKRNHISEG